MQYPLHAVIGLVASSAMIFFPGAGAARASTVTPVLSNSQGLMVAQNQSEEGETSSGQQAQSDQTMPQEENGKNAGMEDEQQGMEEEQQGMEEEQEGMEEQQKGMREEEGSKQGD